MNNRPKKSMGWGSSWTMLFLALSGGCLEPSFLITPVSARRNLVETSIGRDSLLATDKIAVIDVTGLILNAHEPRLVGAGEHSVSRLLEQLDKARSDPFVKAVILRINSPGGGVTASELMYQEIQYFRACTGKPVVAVMLDVAASGGYYIACACDEIIAQPSSVTGSIGVIMQLFDLSGTLDKIGAHSDAITSGLHKDSGSLFRSMRPEERELFQNMVNDMYEGFVKVVVQGRPRLDEASVRRLADGRVYIASQALEEGLVDRVCTMREAIEVTKQRAGVKRARLVSYMRRYDYRPNYYAEAPQPGAGDVNLLKLDLPHWLHGMTPQFMYLWQPGR